MIKIIFLGVGYNDNYQAEVLIYDSCGNIIYSGQTYNGELLVELIRGNVYHIVAMFRGGFICKYLYIGKNNTYYLAFPNIVYNARIVTFLLTDYYYDNLPIERGEITLWQE